MPTKNQVTAQIVRDKLTTAVHQDPANHDLLRGRKSAIEHTIALALDDAERRWPQNRNKPHSQVRDALETVVAFACENQHCSSGAAIRDLLAGIHGGGAGTVSVTALTRMDDELTVPLMTVLTAALAPSCSVERLYDMDFVDAFRARGCEDFFFDRTAASSR